ncbi:peptidyl-prolyl cis-trans isomerase [Bacillus sp. ISL-40]|uniref:peptidyl-prolyl cis-trans isomerase n=1 Tax=unclassified Bacillus (in: firmicutes) TaxID=185979 RepID=UPI001BE688DC|nr:MULTISPECIES: peptidyl-prolyl cis-trans isomerase [unclassified Bacillus (in: firmicutes)]MBT2699369.1 peptidyl-prolyl cis-trans isomerase [Bacillus sp. ISL-40]MBT2743596.1 peptidyl-prolyl cis-trans isomerase [Bacillus sp. ISL-77]
MGRKQLWMVIAALIMVNCLTIAFFLSKANLAGGAVMNEEAVATVGKKTILRQEWLNELEARYGKDVLKEMVDQKVIEEMAAKYKIKISNQDVEREYRMLQATYNSLSKQSVKNEEKWKEQIRSNLLLEELLTKDVEVSNDELSNYYKKNEELFHVPPAFHLSHIVVSTEEEADQALQELAQGSDFSTLAMERSIEEFSANEGGDIGYLSEEDERYPVQYIQIAKELKKGAHSMPIKVDQGYAIIKLEGKINGKKYSFEDVKEQIRRQIALEQMKSPATASTFWDDAKVDWFYGKEGN